MRFGWFCRREDENLPDGGHAYRAVTDGAAGSSNAVDISAVQDATQRCAVGCNAASEGRSRDGLVPDRCGVFLEGGELCRAGMLCLVAPGPFSPWSLQGWEQNAGRIFSKERPSRATFLDHRGDA